MFFESFQTAIVLAMAGYLLQVSSSLQRRNHRSWSDLLTQLRPGLTGSDLTIPAVWREGNISIADLARPARTLRELSDQFHNAGIFLEMADYSDRQEMANHSIEHAAAMETLRRTAMQMRIDALLAFPRCAFNS